MSHFYMKHFVESFTILFSIDHPFFSWIFMISGITGLLNTFVSISLYLILYTLDFHLHHCTYPPYPFTSYQLYFSFTYGFIVLLLSTSSPLCSPINPFLFSVIFPPNWDSTLITPLVHIHHSLYSSPTQSLTISTLLSHSLKPPFSPILYSLFLFSHFLLQWNRPWHV